MQEGKSGLPPFFDLFPNGVLVIQTKKYPLAMEIQPNPTIYICGIAMSL